MNAYFSESWFYEKFTRPECELFVYDREITVDVKFPTTEEDRAHIPVPLDVLSLHLLVEMPQIRPCAFFPSSMKRPSR